MIFYQQKLKLHCTQRRKYLQVQIVFDHFKVRVNNTMVNSSSELWKAYGWVFNRKRCFLGPIVFKLTITLHISLWNGYQLFLRWRREQCFEDYVEIYNINNDQVETTSIIVIFIVICRIIVKLNLCQHHHQHPCCCPLSHYNCRPFSAWSLWTSPWWSSS